MTVSGILGSFSIPFAKMQGLGNDFVVVLERDLNQTADGQRILASWDRLAPALAHSLCERHYGIGADGLILVRSALNSGSDISWLYTNGDGSPSDMCGNGLRCLAQICVESKLVAASEFNVETAAGVVHVSYKNQDAITIDLGSPKLRTQQIPLATNAQEKFVQQQLSVEGPRGEEQLNVTCVSMGNPHCVVFGDFENVGFGDTAFGAAAERIQAKPLFPEGVNVEFATARERNYVKVLVWERGCGPTLACASGAAATLVAGVLEGRLNRRCEIELPGGRLEGSWQESDGHVLLTGPARKVFSGEIDLLKFEALHGLLTAEAACSQ